MVLSDGAVIPFGLGVWYVDHEPLDFSRGRPRLTSISSRRRPRLYPNSRSTGLSPIPFIKDLPFPKDR